MTVDDVKKRLALIRVEAETDDETAHAAQDGLYTDVLQAIADGAEDASGLAREALRVREIEFSRWYA